MNKWSTKIIKIIDTMLPIIIAGLSGVIVTEFILKDPDLSTVTRWPILGVVVIEIVMIIWLRVHLSRKHSDVYKLDTWIKYDKKRIEIEEQMDALSKQLMNSDVSKYIDVNRLIFSGQTHLSGKGLIDYNAFFQQFGLDKGAIKLNENSGAFLTPFNETGNFLYKMCQGILSDAGIFLQRSDNYVDKDDILMNIVSLIVQSELIIANIDGRNPNVYYELGIAHALGKPTILLSERKNNLEDIGFDIQQKYVILYKDYSDLREQLLIKISQIRRK